MLSWITLTPQKRCCSGNGFFMHTKIQKAFPSVLHTGLSWAEKEGPGATEALIYTSAVGKTSIQQPWCWKAPGGFPPWDAPTVPAPLGVFPCGDKVSPTPPHAGFACCPHRWEGTALASHVRAGLIFTGAFYTLQELRGNRWQYLLRCSGVPCQLCIDSSLAAQDNPSHS